MIWLAAIALQTWHPTPCTDRAPGGEARCARRDFITAEQAMVREFDRALYRVRHCQPADSTHCYNTTRALSLMRIEQRSWVAWRNAHCDGFAFPVEGTSAESVIRDVCKTKMTVERTNDIKKIGRSE